MEPNLPFSVISEDYTGNYIKEPSLQYIFSNSDNPYNFF